MEAWLGSSLQISAIEQVEFLEKLIAISLPLSKEAQEYTIQMIKMEQFYEGWQLYGKTGGALQAWFIGFIEKDSKYIVFAQYADLPPNVPIGTSRIAKEMAKDNLVSLILQ